MRDQKHSWLPAALDLTIFYWVQFPDDLVLSISLLSLHAQNFPTRIVKINITLLILMVSVVYSKI